MKKLTSKKMIKIEGGICTKPVNAQAGFCLPCAFTNAMLGITPAAGPGAICLE